MRRSKKNRKILVISLVSVLFLMAVGYAAFQTNLNIKGTSKIGGNFDVEITNIEVAKENNEDLIEGKAVSKKMVISDDKLSVSMEADLYAKEDSVTYQVTIQNKGNLDASLDEIITNNVQTNSAVKISFSGYTKGEIIYKNGSSGDTKNVYVKIECTEDNPEEGSGEVSVSFNYTQPEYSNNNGNITTKNDRYLVTFNCTENGGTDCTNNNEYLESGNTVNLTKTASIKKGYEFIGWNTNKDATEGLTNLSIENSDITLYAIYAIATPPVITTLNTRKATNSITAVTTATDAESGISKYEFKINDGNWIDNGTNNTYTFNNLTEGEAYVISTRVTNGVDLTATTESNTIGLGIAIPTFTEVMTEGAVETIVTITYPFGCTEYICKYQKDSETEVTVSQTDLDKNNSIDITFTKVGTLVAKTADETNNVSSSYTITYPQFNSGTEKLDYSSTVQTFIAPAKGDYYLQVWGAQGGSYNTTYVGGKGGYSYGTIALNKGDKLYIYTGGQPSGYNSSASSNNTNAAGTNGGGAGRTYAYSGTTTYSLGGGGATDIRIDSNNDGETTLYERVIVAGGGSGSSNQRSGYAGGGTQGLGYQTTYVGTQTAAGTGGSFGQGGSSAGNYNYKYGPPGGGGGWYGGGCIAGQNDSSTYYGYATGGGSGYVNTSSSTKPSGYLLTDSKYYLTDAKTVAGDQEFDSPTGGKETGHTGNGYAKITYNVPINEKIKLVSNNITATTISVTANSSEEITKYEFKVNSDQWTDNGTSDSYKFTNLNPNTNYTLYVRATTSSGKIMAQTSITTEDLNVSLAANKVQTTITAIASSTMPEKIIKYEFKIGDDEWIDNGTNNIYEFTGLARNTEYKIQVRITNSNDDKIIDTIIVKTDPISPPTFMLKSVSGKNKKIEITYPSGCASQLSCSYSKNEIDFTETTEDSIIISFTELGSLVAKVSDGTTTVSSSYTLEELTGKLAPYSTLSNTTLYTTYKSDITSVDIVEYNIVPEDAIESWNVSATNSEGIVNAWVIDDTNNIGKYKLYIGSKGGVIANEDSSNLFNGFTSSTSIKLNALDTSKVTNMGSMFQNCTSLSSLDLSMLDTSEVTNMSYMFAGYDGSEETKMTLENINLNNFVTNNVTNMEKMFWNCGNITELNVSDFDTSKVTNMKDMFNMPDDKTSVMATIKGLENFNTSNVTDMSYMFAENNKLLTLNLRNFNTSKVTNMQGMFTNCYTLKTISASDKFVTTSVDNSTNMFAHTTKLVGGNGTIYDLTKLDKEYARIDTSENKGYFTDLSIPVIDNVSTKSTTNSITLIVNTSISEDYSISKIEYSKDGGNTYTEGTLEGDNPYTSTFSFTELTPNKNYPIKIRVTSNLEKIAVYEGGLTTAEQILSETQIVTSGDGLYQDDIETDRYIYKGSAPDNYITFNNGETWRIYSVESDGKIKIIKDENLVNTIFDIGTKNELTGISPQNSTDGTRYSGVSTDFCYSSSKSYNFEGCTAWGSKTTTLDSSGNNVTSQATNTAVDAQTYSLPKSEAYLNVYLNTQFNNQKYNGATLQDYYNISSGSARYIKTASWNIGWIGSINSSEELDNIVGYEKRYQWKGKVGLLTASEYVRANTNNDLCGNLGTLYKNYSTCQSTNYIFKNDGNMYYLLSGENSRNYRSVIYTDGRVSSVYANSGEYGVLPVVYLDSGLDLSGTGKQDEPYAIMGMNSVKTKKMESPTYDKNRTSNGMNVTISYNNDCTKNICEYSTDNGNTWNRSTNTTETISLTEYGTYNFIGKISDGTNSVTASTYILTYTRPTAGEQIFANTSIVTEGDGLYQDEIETDRYIYRGADPDNYITFNGEETWRIYSVENDGSIKIIKDDKLETTVPYDAGYSYSITGITSSNSISGTRYSGSNTYYCYGSSSTNYYGCNSWGSDTTTLDEDENNITNRSQGNFDLGTTFILPTSEAYLNVYLNTQFNNQKYNGITLPSYYTIDSTSADYIKTATWNIGASGYGGVNNKSGLLATVNYEKTYKWSGKIGLPTSSEFIRANSNMDLCGTSNSQANNADTCATTNYLTTDYTFWSMSTRYGSRYDPLHFNGKSDGDGYPYYSYGVRPMLYLCPGITLSGSGTSIDPYTISGSCSS